MQIQSIKLLAVMVLCALPWSAQAREYGAVLEDSKTYEKIPLSPIPARGGLPVRADLSPRFPVPGDQGKQGSCVGWAVAYALKSYQEKVERKWSGTTAAETFSPAFLYNQIKLEGGGAHISDALDFLIRVGAVSLGDFPYSDKDDSTLPGTSLQSAAREFAIATWRRIDLSAMTDTKSHLASGFPVVICMQVTKSFENHRGNSVFEHDPGEEHTGAHAMCVVAYDDAKRAVKLINSWGQTWGDGGFAWVSYDTYLAKVREAFVTQDIVINRPLDSPTIEPYATPDSPWVFADSDRRLLSPEELRVCSSYQLWRARNEIYARHGYRFSSARGLDYAKKLGPHYQPRYGDADAVEATFNQTENTNIALMIAFEQGRPDRVGPLPSNPWIFSDSAARRLTAIEIQRLSGEGRWRARNEIYARNGYIFQSERGKALCRSLGKIYRPVSANMNAISARLNGIEQYNVALIERCEK